MQRASGACSNDGYAPAALACRCCNGYPTFRRENQPGQAVFHTGSVALCSLRSHGAAFEPEQERRIALRARSGDEGFPDAHMVESIRTSVVLADCPASRQSVVAVPSSMDRAETRGEPPQAEKRVQLSWVYVGRLIVDLRAIKRFCIVQLGCPAGRSS